MAEKITEILDDASAVGIQLSLNDSSGGLALANAITGITFTWTDITGNPINSRTDVVVSVANPAVIPLDEVDTAVTVNKTKRLLTVTWIYNDTLLGAGSQKVKEYQFKIYNFINK